MNGERRLKPVPDPAPLNELVLTHLVGAVQFGTVTIRYQHGRPTHVERLEVIRLTEDPPPR